MYEPRAVPAENGHGSWEALETAADSRSGEPAPTRSSQPRTDGLEGGNGSARRVEDDPEAWGPPDAPPSDVRDDPLVEGAGPGTADLPARAWEPGFDTTRLDALPKQAARQAVAGCVEPGAVLPGSRRDVEGRGTNLHGSGRIGVLARHARLANRMAFAAASADSTVVAERLVAGVVPLALGVERRLGEALWPVVPALIEGSARVVRLLHGDPATRHLIVGMPSILRRTVNDLALIMDRKGRLTRKDVARALARQVWRSVHSASAPDPNTRHASTDRPATLDPNGDDYDSP